MFTDCGTLETSEKSTPRHLLLTRIGPATDGTFRRTCESSPLLHCVPTKEGLNQSCVCEPSWILVDLPHNSACNPTAERKELLHCGQDATSSGSKCRAAKCRVQKKNIRRRRRAARWESQQRRLWLAKGAEVGSPQPFGGTSSGCYCSAPSLKMLHEAEVGGTKTGTQCWNHTGRDCIVIRLIP